MNLTLKPKGFALGLYNLSKAQQKLKNEIYIISGNQIAKNIKNLKSNKLYFNIIPSIPSLSLINNMMPFGIFSFFRLNQLLKNNMIDLIHTHDIDAVYAIKKNNNVPLVTSFEVDKRAQMQRLGLKNISIRTRFLEYINYQFTPMVWRKSKAIICISRQTMNRLVNIYKVPSSKIHYIPNGINIDEFNPSIKPSNLKSSLKINHHHPIILFIGRIFDLKGIKELILALARIKPMYPDILLILIGSIFNRNYYQEIKLKIKQKNLTENVLFTGEIPHSILPQFYRLADIFVLPSYSEGLPYVLLEAMASRLCVIVSAIEGIRDVIKNNENGILIRPKIISEISDNLIKVIEDKNLREKLSLNAWKTAQNYDWVNIAQKIQNVYEAVLNR